MLIKCLFTGVFLCSLVFTPKDARAFVSDFGFNEQAKFYELNIRALEKAKQGKIPEAKAEMVAFVESNKQRADLLIYYCGFLSTIEEFNELKLCADKAFGKLKVIARRITPGGKPFSSQMEFFTDQQAAQYESFLKGVPVVAHDAAFQADILFLMTTYMSVGQFERVKEVLSFAEATIREGGGLDAVYINILSADPKSLDRRFVQTYLQKYKSSRDKANKHYDFSYYKTQIELYANEKQEAQLLRLIDHILAFTPDQQRGLLATNDLQLQLPEQGLATVFPVHIKMSELSYQRLLAVAFHRAGIYKKAEHHALTFFEQNKLLSANENYYALDVDLFLKDAIQILLDAGNTVAARHVFDQYAAQETIIFASPDKAEILGKILTAEDRTNEAILHYRKSIDAFELRRQHIRSEDAKIEFTARMQRLYEELIFLLLDSEQVELAFEYADRSKSRALIDMIQQRNINSIVSSNPMYESQTPLLEKLKVAEYQVRAAHLRGESIANSEALSSYQRVLETLETKAPAIADLLRAKPTPLSKLQTSLPARAALIQYYAGQSKLYAFVVTRNSVRAVSLKHDLLGRVEEYRRALQQVDKSNSIRLGKMLYQEFIAPLNLEQGADLLIVPHESLHYLPFSALPAGTGYLADLHTIRTLPSVALFKNNTQDSKKSIAQSSVLLVGNPDLGNRSFDLPGAEEEVTALSNLFPERHTILLRQKATKQAVSENFAKKDILHFALHGIFNAEDPLASGLALASDKPDTSEPLQGLLTVEELYGLSTRADLIVLSACDTGLGAIKNGDEVVGLNRALFFTGASNVLSSLWAVDDQSTTLLMRNFYSFLGQHPKERALQLAMRETRKVYPSPYHWAAFVLSGVE